MRGGFDWWDRSASIRTDLLVSASVRRIHEGILARAGKLTHVPSQTLPSTGFACAKLLDL
jgi:hypothetical protein